METETIVESNRATPILIVKKRTKKISNEAYLSGTNLKEWNLQEIILERVQRESEAMYA